MSKQAVDHHQKAAEHHEHAARHHREAASHHEAGKHETAAHHAHLANGHHQHATHHASEAAKAHIEFTAKPARPTPKLFRRGAHPAFFSRLRVHASQSVK